MRADPCPICSGRPAARPGGMFACPDCGVVYDTVKVLNTPVYEAGLEEGIYGAAKKQLFDEALDFLAGTAAAGEKLLDVGCAGGELLKAAAARGWKPEGVELDPLLALKSVAQGFYVSSRPVEDSGFEENAYGAATVFEVFSLMDRPAAAVAELYRLLVPGGVIYIREFNSGFHLPMHALEELGVFRPLGLSPSILHHFNFRARTLRVMLERAGFTGVRIRNSRPTAGDPYRTGGRLGGFLTGAAKVLYYGLAQALWILSFGRAFLGSTLIATARKK